MKWWGGIGVWSGGDVVWTYTFDGHVLLLVVQVWHFYTRGWVGEVCELGGLCMDPYL